MNSTEKLVAIPLDDKKTWDMICDGHTKGVFQLENWLGSRYCKKAQPRSIEELSDIISIIRPGCLEAKLDGKSLTDVYCLRKHGKAPVEYVHPALEPILKETQGILVFQEQAIRISKDIAGFSMAESETLRKCVTDDTMLFSHNHGWISIKDLLKENYKNDKFWSFDFKRCEYVWVEIENIWSTGVKKVNEVVLDNGMSVICTPDHGICINEYGSFRKSGKCVDYNSFTVIDSNGPYKHREIKRVERKHLDFLQLIGAITFCGYIFGKGGKDKSFFSHSNDYVLSKYIELYERVFNKKPTFYNKNQLRIGYQERQLICGWVLDHAKHAKTKKLIQDICSLHNEDLKEVIAFILMCGLERRRSGDHIEFSIKSKILAKQIQLILDHFDICTTILTKNNKFSQKYTIRFSDINSAYKLLDICDGYLSDETKDRIGQILSSGSLKVQNNNFPKIIEIRKKHSKRTVYDFTVKSDTIHWLFANGILIHNSIGKKLPELMAKIESQFIDKAKSHGVVDEESARTIWENIKKAQRYSFNKSVTLDTIVETEYGYKQIKDISIDEMILSPNINNENAFVRVVNKFDHGIQNVYEVCLESGKRIKCTLQHKFLCKDGKIHSLADILYDGLEIMCKD